MYYITIDVYTPVRVFVVCVVGARARAYAPPRTNAVRHKGGDEEETNDLLS